MPARPGRRPAVPCAQGEDMDLEFVSRQSAGQQAELFGRARGSSVSMMCRMRCFKGATMGNVSLKLVNVTDTGLETGDLD